MLLMYLRKHLVGSSLYNLEKIYICIDALVAFQDWLLFHTIELCTPPPPPEEIQTSLQVQKYLNYKLMVIRDSLTILYELELQKGFVSKHTLSSRVTKFHTRNRMRMAPEPATTFTPIKFSSSNLSKKENKETVQFRNRLLAGRKTLSC